MAELRKRGAGFSSVVQDCKETPDSPPVRSYSKKSASLSWMFFSILLFYILSLYVSFKASRTVPAPKTKLGSSVSEFVEERARKHLDAITSFGPRPAGSYANEIQAVNYIVGALQTIKDTAREDVIIEIDIQRPTGSFDLGFFAGFTSFYRNVTNILVRITPKDSYPPKNTVLLNGHFDSVPGSPGASDDAVSCAVMLELLRCIAQTRNFRFTHGVVFNFNGAEENILQASHGFITQHRWVDTIRAFVNLEAAGAGGKEIVFQAGPDHPWLIKTYAEVAPHPCAQALGQDLFQSGLIPSDTDFRIYRDFGKIPGMDLAYTANGYVYHTNYDSPAAVTSGSIQRAGDNILALVKSIINSPFLADPGEYRHGAMVFFDFLGVAMVHYPERIGFVLNIVTAAVAVLCLIKKFIGFPAKKNTTEGETAIQGSSLSDLFTSLLVLLLSWVVGIAVPVTIGLLLTYTGHSLTWYCRPYLLLVLYAAPSLFGVGFVHFLARRSLLSKRGVIEKDKQTTSPEDRTASCLAARETETFYASLLVWTIILSILTYYRLASAHLPWLLVIFPLIVRVFIWENFFLTKTSHQKLGAFVFMYLLATLIPIQFCTYVTISVFDVFVPIMGRAGTQTPPDVFIAVLCSFAVVMLTSYAVSTVYVMGNLKLPATFLVLVSALALLTSLSGLSFPYSAANQCPKRVFFQHTSRTFYNNEENVILEDSGVWITPLDYLGIQPFSDIPIFKKALPAPQEGVYGGFPYYLPLRDYVRNSWYLPGPPPQPTTSQMEVKLIARKQHDQVYTFKFQLSGPDHMTVYLSPASGVDLLTSSLGSLYPIEDHNGGDRVTYFIYYSHGTDVGPWELSLDLVAHRKLPAKSSLLDFAVAAQYIHGKESSSPFLEEVMRFTPDWVFANDWVDTYKSWSFTT
ncbi:hypothetical protein ACROYT_G043577 [Oculina patagonica]